jgi:hypothetical protein
MTMSCEKCWRVLRVLARRPLGDYQLTFDRCFIELSPLFREHMKCPASRPVVSTPDGWRTKGSADHFSSCYAIAPAGGVVVGKWIGRAAAAHSGELL